MAKYKFIKNKDSDVIWWVDDPETRGEWLFTFDKVTKRQKEIFDKENPYWADFFSDRK